MTRVWNNFKMFLWLTFLTGLVYPLLVTLIAQMAWNTQANGNFLVKNGKTLGAPLIGQKFETPGYFWGRPSAVDYQPLPSGASNLAPTSQRLKTLVEERRSRLAKLNESSPEEVPSELLFASASGIDPHISPETAYWQIERIIKARKLDPVTGQEAFRKLIDQMTTHRSLGFIGTTHVNVLQLNLALDELEPTSK